MCGEGRRRKERGARSQQIEGIDMAEEGKGGGVGQECRWFCH